MIPTLVARGRRIGTDVGALLGGISDWTNAGQWREFRYGRGYAFVVIGLIAFAIALGFLALWTAKPDESSKGSTPAKPGDSDRR